MQRLLDFLEAIIIKLIDKLNIFIILLLLVIFGIMNKKEVFEWISALGQSASDLLP